MTIRRSRLFVQSLLFLCVCSGFGAPASAQGRTRNVILIVSDGVRWQEIFHGADPSLLNYQSGGSWEPEAELRRKFWNDDEQARRKMLFPFLWSVVAQQGQVLGNQEKGSIARVSNGMAFSYPGYNEMVTGHPDPQINSNSFGPNPNISVFEWMNGKPEFRNKVAVFGTWEVFKNIFNEPRSHLFMQAGWDLPQTEEHGPRQELLNQLFRTTTHLEEDDLWDSFLQVPLLDYLKAKQPRLLFVGYGETDSWAHAGRYDLVLESAHQFDRFVQQIWTTIQSMPQYKDQTTLLITTDHGRGSGLTDWKNHGKEAPGSENIWLAAIGPDTKALGERANSAPIVQAQIAGTAAALLGQHFSIPSTAIAQPVADLLPTSKVGDGVKRSAP